MEGGVSVQRSLEKGPSSFTPHFLSPQCHIIWRAIDTLPACKDVGIALTLGPTRETKDVFEEGRPPRTRVGCCSLLHISTFPSIPTRMLPHSDSSYVFLAPHQLNSASPSFPSIKVLLEALFVIFVIPTPTFD
jgi:hypothetical protein